MKRDWGIIRSILLQRIGIGSSPNPMTDEWLGHVEMLVSGGYLDATTYDLTWLGFDLIETIRDDHAWSKCQQAIDLNCGGLPTILLLEVARGAIRAKPATIPNDGDAFAVNRAVRVGAVFRT